MGTFFLFAISQAFPQSNQWAWMQGDNFFPLRPIYGTKGVEAPSNKPQGRRSAVSWRDRSGNLWLFGGAGYLNDNGSLTGYLNDLNDLWKYTPSTGLWTWVSGDNTANQRGVYGTRGVAAATNKPGARENAMGWTDTAGNLWLFGGINIVEYYPGSYLNDLWKFDTGSGLWTWMSGDSSFGRPGVYGSKGLTAPANKPGARSAGVGWTDSTGHLWLMGGNGYAASGNANFLNDLWQYDLASGQWTWVQGDSASGQRGTYGTRGVATPGNRPGARYNHVGWTDASGNLWLFGGAGYGLSDNSTGSLNDLWNYAPSTGLWTWVSGSNLNGDISTYGTKGVAAPGNKPGGRSSSIGWTDAAGDFWLFGGLESSYRNDLWKYTVSTGLWTWVSGDNITTQPGKYNTKGVAAPTNKPGAKIEAMGWIDPQGHLWLMGGTTSSRSLNYSVTTTVFNDLWQFDPASSQWTWMSGDNDISSLSVYGIRGTAAPGNTPGARNGAVTWSDAAGDGWLFGGFGYASSAYGALNDLWKYTASTGWWTWISGDTTENARGVYGTKGTPAATNKPRAAQYAQTWIDTAGNLWMFGGYSYEYTGTGTGYVLGYLNDLWKFDPKTGLWTWMNGSGIYDRGGSYGIKGIEAASNMPNNRYRTFGWADAVGNLWLFGGFGYFGPNSTGTPGGSFNDLWKFSIATNQWTWMSGDATRDQPSVYGTQGVAAAANKPAAQVSGIGWKDGAGNLWLFGSGYTELWKYTPSSGWWTWMGGTSQANQAAVYGTKGIPAAGNRPGSRSEAASWSDTAGNVWVFGGTNFSNNSLRYLNDLWKYTASSGLWTWVSGSNTANQSGIYGPKGSAGSGYLPGGRSGAAQWTDAKGNLWLFGGHGLISNTTDITNDVWQYTIPQAALPVKWSSFTAQKQQQAVLLSWTSTQEQNSRYFIVERSPDGLRYDSIGLVMAKGTASAPSSYYYSDKLPLPGTGFYRLKQTDRDGGFQYSAVVKVGGDRNDAQFAIVQNPVQSTLQLSIQLPSNQKFTLQVRNMNGQLLMNEERLGSEGSGIYSIPVDQLKQGTYVIRVNAKEFSGTKTFIRQ